MEAWNTTRSSLVWNYLWYNKYILFLSIPHRYEVGKMARFVFSVRFFWYSVRI